MRLIATTALVLATVAIGACGSETTGGSSSEADSQSAPGDADSPSASPEVRASVEPTRLGPLRFSVDDPEPAEPNEADPWLEHELRYRNDGDTALRFENQRSSTFLGEGKKLLVGDDGCGYVTSDARSPIKPGFCTLNLDRINVEPGATATRSVTLWKGLRGMAPLTDGTYVFKHPVELSVEGEPLSTVLRISYEITGTG